MAVTIRDVAEAAKVSPKTISRVLNNERWVQPETRDRVLRAVKALDYHPNPLARGLHTDHMRTLGIVVPDLANPFFAEAIDGCAEEAERRGFGVSLATSRDDPEREASQIQSFLAQRVSGLLLWDAGIDPPTLGQLMERFNRSCPAVFINGQSAVAPSKQAPFDSILVSERHVGKLATQHLLNEGRHDIAFLGAQTGSRWISELRLAGYKETLLANGIQPQEDWVHHARRATIREGLIAASTLLSLRARPDSIFAINDLLAVGALLACRRAGLQVPEDVAVVGVDDTEIAVVSQPPLTSIRLHQREIGQRAVALVLSMAQKGVQALAGTAEPPRPDLIVRRSSTMRVAGVLSPDDIDDRY